MNISSRLVVYVCVGFMSPMHIKEPMGDLTGWFTPSQELIYQDLNLNQSNIEFLVSQHIDEHRKDHS